MQAGCVWMPEIAVVRCAAGMSVGLIGARSALGRLQRLQRHRVSNASLRDVLARRLIGAASWNRERCAPMGDDMRRTTPQSIPKNAEGALHMMEVPRFDRAVWIGPPTPSDAHVGFLNLLIEMIESAGSVNGRKTLHSKTLKIETRPTSETCYYGACVSVIKAELFRSPCCQFADVGMQ